MTALVVLAACGPRKPTVHDDEEGGAGDGDGDSTSESAGESDTGPAVAMCTLDNFETHPDRGQFMELGCVPVEDDGTCLACDQACMEAILWDCPIDDCCSDASCSPQDVSCIEGCVGHQLLCSEPLGDECCHLVTADHFGGIPGRPLRDDGAALLPALELLDDHPTAHEVEPGAAQAAATYREFARYERASVDAFLHAAILLEGLGAPAELIAAHHEAARQEATHARLALAAAEAVDGRRARLGDLPAAGASFELVAFVRDLARDGCVGELLAAREAIWAAAQPELTQRAELLGYWRTVANDEAEHAALAWRTLEWLLDVQPGLRGEVVDVFADAFAPRPGPPPADGDEREAYGLATPAIASRLREEVLAELQVAARVTLEASGAALS
ncbi:hypothetical protein [Enhygromyxa salina]|uniref:hypothetical protein n=1 Tax=Enhygromyxa salina TaxID=215803 RepID=UPI0011B23443|nr:hypothetical protein [Enhygromyxa salina]